MQTEKLPELEPQDLYRISGIQIKLLQVSIGGLFLILPAVVCEGIPIHHTLHIIFQILSATGIGLFATSTGILVITPLIKLRMRLDMTMHDQDSP